MSLLSTLIGKFNSNVSAAYGSNSFAYTVSNPACSKPISIPPTPAKKEAHFICRLLEEDCGAPLSILCYVL